MVRFYVGRKQPGSTVLLSDAHHVVEVPPYMLPPVTEGSLVDMELRINWEETERRKIAFIKLQQEIVQMAENDYFINTPSPVCIYKNTTEIAPSSLFVHLSREPLNIEELHKLQVTHVLEINESEKELDLPETLIHKHVRVGGEGTGTKDISDLLDGAIDFIDEGIQSGHAVMLHGLNELVECLAIAYFVRCKRLRLSVAANHVKRRLPGVAPSFAFMSQLQTYEQTILNVQDSSFLAEYVTNTLPGLTANVEDFRKVLEANKNDVSKAMDILCASTPQTDANAILSEANVVQSE